MLPSNRINGSKHKIPSTLIHKPAIPALTKLVDAIERKGFVVRQQNKNDRRSNTLVLTEKAMLLKPVAKQKGISILDKMLEGISEEELRAFLETLHKLNQNMIASESED